MTSWEGLRPEEVENHKNKKGGEERRWFRGEKGEDDMLSPSITSPWEIRRKSHRPVREESLREGPGLG